LPVVSVPIVQIAFGAALALLPLGFQLELDPELFFVLFVAPLIFHVSLLADKKTMWAQRKPILNMGVLLVFVTVVIVGYLLNFLIPSIPLAAAFALIAALGPTDDVAVASVSKRTNVPPKIMNILQGESIINDASGIVSFQFALVAMLTGSFSLMQATGRFFIVAIGGIAVGLALSWFKYNFVKWIRSLGMENITLHLLLEILTPFIVYLIAEALSVSGILAIFAAGIFHSFNRSKFSPERVNFNIASHSVWSMLTYTLEGMVFVILGTQLPKILSTISENTYPIATWQIIAYIFLIMFLLLLIRFVWSIVAVKKRTYDDPEHPISRIKAGIIFSLSGARGAVTLASVMSIPLFMSDGSAFPERDLLILIAGGVIVVSLIITSFILPLFVAKKAGANKCAEYEAYLEIIHNVIAELKNSATPENEAATSFIIANYYIRSEELQRKQGSCPINREEERKMLITVHEWEKENVLQMLECGETDEFTAQHYLSVLDSFIEKLSKHRFDTFKKNILHFLRNNRRRTVLQEHIGLREKVVALMKASTKSALEKLRKMSETDDNPVIRKVMADYELRMSLYHRHSRQGSRPHQNDVDNEILSSVFSYGFQVERDNIHEMLELGRISRETAKEMRHNISLLEVQLKKEYF
jgi:CPA1 family monovalent cation:H+ antiporter